MSRVGSGVVTSRVRVVAVHVPESGWYGCIEHVAVPIAGAPLGRVSDRVACAVLFAVVFSPAHLGRVAGRMVVPKIPAVREVAS